MVQCDYGNPLNLLQINYLIDEAVNTGKGANSIISMVHHFLATHSLGEVNLHLHADNCSGQNKNRYVMQYLAWRVLSGLNKYITLSFLIVGHTKFSPDWCLVSSNRPIRGTKLDAWMILYGWWKSQLRRTTHSLLEPWMAEY